MDATIQLIDLLGAAALLLWGLRLIKTGILRAYGAVLRQWIGRGTGNRLAAAFWGFVATLGLQSSTATAVITCSASGLTGGAKTASSANISIYPHRIAGSTTTARHKELTDAAIMNDGLYNVLGLAQRDQMQGHKHTTTAHTMYAGVIFPGPPGGGSMAIGAISDPTNDGTNGAPRTGLNTRPRSGIFNFYAYVGTYSE